MVCSSTQSAFQWHWAVGNCGNWGFTWVSCCTRCTIIYMQIFLVWFFLGQMFKQIFWQMEKGLLRGLIASKFSNQKKGHVWHYQVIILCVALLQSHFCLSDTPKLDFVFDFVPWPCPLFAPLGWLPDSGHPLIWEPDLRNSSTKPAPARWALWSQFQFNCDDEMTDKWVLQ